MNVSSVLLTSIEAPDSDFVGGVSGVSFFSGLFFRDMPHRNMFPLRILVGCME